MQVTLKPEWQYISFRYYDRHKKSEEAVPQYLMIEGYNEDVDDDVPVTKSNLFKDNCICLPWIEDKNKARYRDAKKMVFKFETYNTFIKSDGTPTIVKDTISNIRSKPLTERFKYYDLPKKWESKNWIVKLGVEEDVFEKMVNKKTTILQPLIVDLDSVVLTDDDLNCKSWDKDDRFTVFDIKMEVTNLDPDKPYWTRGKLKTNFFTKEIVGNEPRIISLNGKFYDITDKRSREGDVIGACAAVEDDKDVHYGDDLKRPVCNAGNFDLHYFTDCLDSAGTTPICVLLIYWSCEFKKGRGVTDNDIKNFQKFGMTNAKKRWELKGYKFKAKVDPSGKGIEVKPVFFFEGREKSPYKCSVTVNTPGGRAGMGISSANFKTIDYTPSGLSITEDGKSFAWFTMAHELGHVVGLDDEYLESIEEDNIWDPVLPQFSQYYPGMPYSFDYRSIMVRNRAPRLRHFWYFCRWLNETDEIKKLTGNTVFQVNYSGGTNYNYFLKDYTKNFYKPAYDDDKEGVKNGKHGRFDLFLYKIGDDETTKRMIRGKTFDSILVVRLKLQWFFDDYNGNRWANDEEKVEYLRDFQTAIGIQFEQKILS